MKTLLLDRTAWDLVLDANGNIALADNPYSIAQDVASAIQTFIGECWYDTTLGLPYWESILGELPPLSFVREKIEKAALSIPEVAKVKSVFVSFQDRVLTGQVQIIDQAGNESGSNILTAVPNISFTTTGVVLPKESDILTGVQTDIDAAFGGGVNPSLQTPQGQIAQSLTAIVGDKNNQIAEIANQVNPDFASGRWQEAIGRIYFINRIAGAGTVVNATCTGLVGTVIPAGTVAQDSAGYLYSSLSTATIDATGSVNVQFQNQTDGEIACPIGALSVINTAVIGWERITNNSAGVLGNLVESRAEFEERRKLTVAKNAINSLDAIQANVWEVPGVLDVYAAENYTGAPVTIGATNYTLSPHSLYLAVVGGASADIAKAMWESKSLGCDMNGNTQFINDYPYYKMKWQTPTPVSVGFDVQIQQTNNLPSTIVTDTKNAILAAFNGLDNSNAKATIGKTIYASRYYCAVNAISTNLQIVMMQVGEVGDVTHQSLAIGVDEVPTLDISNITVTLI